MPSARLAAVAAFLSFALAACSAVEPGWTYAPPPSPTPLAAAFGSPGASRSAEPSGSSPSAEPSGATGGTVVKVVAAGLKFTAASLSGPADEPFRVELDNQDAGVPHNFTIRDATGADLFAGDSFSGPEVRTYDVKPIAAGTYRFICTVHPATMTGELIVR